MRKYLGIIAAITIFTLLMVSCNRLIGSSGGNEDAINTMVAQTIAAGNVEAPVVIITATSEQVTLPTITPQSGGATPATPGGDSCFEASFKGDVTIPDGSLIIAGTTFVKTWSVQNLSTCTWHGYTLVNSGGDNLGAAASTPLPDVLPGQTIDVSVTMTAPATNGEYTQYFMLKSDTGFQFGTGSGYVHPFYAKIEVIQFYALTLAPTLDFSVIPLIPLETSVYNFASNYCSATWKNGSGALPCPGTTSDATGFVVRNDSPYLQNGDQYDGPTLFTHPQWIDNGTIAGFYPGLDVKDGYRFKATLGCGYNGGACEALLQLNYSSDGGPTTLFQQWTIKYGDAPVEVNLDLSSLAGHNVKFILAVSAKGSSAQDWVQWVNPRIVK
jgi:hypothetical protein